MWQVATVTGIVTVGFCFAAESPTVRKPLTVATSLPLYSDTKLVSCAHYLPVRDGEVQHLLALYLTPSLILQRCHDLLRGNVDDFSGGRVGEPAVHAEADPAGQVAKLDAAGLPGRHDRSIEHMNRIVGPIRHPQLLLVGGQSDAVARARMTLDGTLPVSLDLHSIELLAGAHVAHFESQQAIDVHEAEGVASVDSERADEV